MTAAFALGLVFASIAAAAAIAWVRQLQAQRDAWADNWRKECRRHDNTLYQLQRTQAQLAAVTTAIEAAALEPEAHGPAVRLGGDVRERFSVN